MTRRTTPARRTTLPMCLVAAAGLACTPALAQDSGGSGGTGSSGSDRQSTTSGGATGADSQTTTSQPTDSARDPAGRAPGAGSADRAGADRNQMGRNQPGNQPGNQAGNQADRTQPGRINDDEQWYDPRDWFDDDFENDTFRDSNLRDAEGNRTPGRSPGVNDPNRRDTGRTPGAADPNRRDTGRTPGAEDPNRRDAGRTTGIEDPNRRDAGRTPGAEDPNRRDAGRAVDPNDPSRREAINPDRGRLGDASDRFDRRRPTGDVVNDGFDPYGYDNDRTAVSGTMYSDGYYDGYYDGYNDDSFGYDAFGVTGRRDGGSSAGATSLGQDDAGRRSARGTRDRYFNGYSSGYYDGYYDKQSGYDADWTFYQYGSPVGSGSDAAPRSATGRDRAQDPSRMRGDRMGEHDWSRGSDVARSYTGNNDRPNDRMNDRSMNGRGNDRSDPGLSDRGSNRSDRGTGDRSAMNDDWRRGYATDTSQVRGEVRSVSRMSGDAGQNLVTINFKDGRSVTADLGPGARADMIQMNDRVTLRGVTRNIDGREVLEVNRVAANDRIMWRANGNGS